MEFWEVVSHFPSKFWATTPADCGRHQSHLLSATTMTHSRSGWTGPSATWRSSGCPCSLQGPWTSKFPYKLNLSKIFWCYFNSVQPSTPIPPLLLPLVPPLILFAPFLVSFWHTGEEKKKDNRWNIGVQLLSLEAESQCNTALVLFPSYMGKFKISSHSKSTKLSHCPKKPCKNQKSFFRTIKVDERSSHQIHKQQDQVCTIKMGALTSKAGKKRAQHELMGLFTMQLCSPHF